VAFVFVILFIAASHYNTILIYKNKDKQDVFALMCGLVPLVTVIVGVVASWLTNPIFYNRYAFPSFGLLALSFGITMRGAKKSLLVIIAAFLLLVGAVQYRENFRAEYHNTYTAQTVAFFQENLQENDYIVYNYELFDFIYECYWPAEQLVHIDRFDFSKDFRVVWLLNTAPNGWMETESNAYNIWQRLSDNSLYMDPVLGNWGIEHNPFSIFKIEKGEPNELWQ
jgi:hypothetical protein